jgi:hypothetical protein
MSPLFDWATLHKKWPSLCGTYLELNKLGRSKFADEMAFKDGGLFLSLAMKRANNEKFHSDCEKFDFLFV